MDTIDCPKCEHEHEACGSHEDDSGERECESCGFKFEVEIEYEPTYLTTCVAHEFSGRELRTARNGGLVGCRVCRHCQLAVLSEQTSVT